MRATNVPRACWICGQLVMLEDCKVDEHGMAVHEKCYVVKIRLQRVPGQSSLQSSEQA